MKDKFKEVNTYEATISGNIYQVGWLISHMLLLSLIPVYFYFEFGEESVQFALISVAFLYVAQLTIHALFFIRYWDSSSGKSICFNKNDIIYTDGEQSVNFKPVDIESIETVISKAKYSGLIRWFPWDSYCYSIIKLKTGQSCLITSLMIRELYWPKNLSRENKTIKIFCWL